MRGNKSSTLFKEIAWFEEALSNIPKQEIVLSFTTDLEFDQWILDKDFETCASCQKCDLGSQSLTGIFGEGTASSKLLVIGDYPSKREESLKRAFVDPAGILVRKILAKLGYKKSDVFFTHSVACRPSKRSPTKEERIECRWRIKKMYQTVRPKSILLLGKYAASICNLRGVEGNRGLVDPDNWGILHGFMDLKRVVLTQSHRDVIAQESEREQKKALRSLISDIRILKEDMDV
jgi:uracil-DNA glycosylase family 4